MQRVFRSFALAAAVLLALGGAAALAAYGPAHALRSANRATVSPPAENAPAWLCRAQRDAMGAAAFNQFWAARARSGRNATAKCIAYMAHANAQGSGAATERTIMSSVQLCKTERRSNPAGFRRHFGATTHATNALGKCVRAHAKLVGRRTGR